jgi:L,D-transpeptidase ErfK/SrfK
MKVAMTSWMLAGLAALAVGSPAGAGARFVLPANGDSVVGAVTTTIAVHDDTLLDIGRRYGVGYEEIIAANPGVDPWLPGAGTEVLIPSRFVIPDAPREGIVVNLPEHRLYYFPPAKAGEPRTVITYPISVGRMDWNTPLGVTKIASKRERPTWYPPKSVREEHARKGNPLPESVPPGPDNPLGEYAMRLAIPSGAYLIHGTNRPAGVGMQVTAGCIRLFPEHIAELYGLVPVGTKVNLVNQTNKVGWGRGTLYVERQAPLDGTEDPTHSDFAELRRLVEGVLQGRPVEFDWQEAQRVFEQANGVPVALSVPVRSAAR